MTLGKFYKKIITHCIGTVDLLIAAEAKLLECQIYSFDRVFEKLAKFDIVSLY